MSGVTTPCQPGEHKLSGKRSRITKRGRKDGKAQPVVSRELAWLFDDKRDKKPDGAESPT